jgi:N6-L-threonylcarbamoyladenine synthase
VAYPAECLVVVGGVAASPQLREGATQLCEKLGVKLCLPPLKWSTDNAAMIGLAAWDYLNAGVQPPLFATASLKISEF